MSPYSYLQYLRHKFTAKNRHGIHSPYVYRFVDEVMSDFSSFDMPSKFNNFFGRKNMRYIASAYPTHWPQLVAKEMQEMHNDLVIAIPNIYKSPEHKEYWQQLAAMPEVKLSLDTYEFGLLLFRNEFLAKQHFAVKG
ncbi:MAG: hypothetical protein EOP51_04750 [Sphingobacteriales bacterium]|nr:MAG: hypothetical protein EOP51_04750 [Sphingobacteriales bacterium]